MSFSVFFASYEALKQSIRNPYLAHQKQVNAWANETLSLNDDAVKALVRVSWTLAGGMIAGSLQQIVDTPIRTIRYALEVLKDNEAEYLYKDARQYITTVMKEHTWRTIVRQTFGAGLFRAMPPAAIAFAIFETTLSWED